MGIRHVWELKDSLRRCWTVTAKYNGKYVPDKDGFYESIYDVKVISPELLNQDTSMMFQITTQYDEPIKLEDVWYAIDERMKYLTVAMLTYRETGDA